MLIEAAIGDAYGLGFEMANEARYEELDPFEYEPLPKYMHYYEHYSDDTQMAIGITELLVEKVEWTPLNIAAKFVEGFKRDVRSGYAGGFFHFLKTIKDGEEFLEKIRPTSERNGASMRAFPLGILATEKDVLEKTKIQAALTHNTKEGITAAQIVALSTHFCLYKKGKRAEIDEYLHDWIDFDWKIHWEGWVSIRGRDAVLAALTLVKKYNKLSQILLECIRFRGDVDTVGTIAMAIASCCSEIEQDLPAWTINKLENDDFGKDYILKLDQQLLALKQ